EAPAFFVWRGLALVAAFRECALTAHDAAVAAGTWSGTWEPVLSALTASADHPPANAPEPDPMDPDVAGTGAGGRGGAPGAARPRARRSASPRLRVRPDRPVRAGRHPRQYIMPT